MKLITTVFRVKHDIRRRLVSDPESMFQCGNDLNMLTNTRFAARIVQMAPGNATAGSTPALWDQLDAQHIPDSS